MDHLMYYSLAAVLGFLSFLLQRQRQRQHSPPLPPGPGGLPIVGSLFSLDPDLHTHFAALAKTYGPIFRLRLGSKLGVVISSPSVAREVLRDHDATFANRDVPAVASVIAYGASDIVWTPNGPALRMLRRVCVRELLAGASLDAAYGLRRREVRAVVAHLRTRSQVLSASNSLLSSVPYSPYDQQHQAAPAAGEAVGVDVGALMFVMTMNVITSALWGGTVTGGEGVGREFREVVSEITRLLGQPNLSDFFPSIAGLDLQGIGKKMGRLLKRFDSIFEGIIEKRMKTEAEGEEKDFLEYMLRLEKEGVDRKTPFTMTHVKALLMDMVVGGTETTSNTVEWAMAEMLQKPEILRRAQQELDEVVGEDQVVEESHVPKLTYLSAVIKEVLRLHPALPLLVPHCPSSPSIVGGYTVPQGSRVFINVWAIHRDPALWPDSLEFRPERFLDSKWDYSGNDFSYFPFGSGRRICAGISMAERMVGYALATLVHSFNWQLPEGAKLELSERFGIVLKKAEPLIAVPSPRLDENKLYE